MSKNEGKLTAHPVKLELPPIIQNAVTVFRKLSRGCLFPWLLEPPCSWCEQTC